MPDAFHDSSARYPPPHCHPGTRQDFIEQITDWGIGSSHDPKRILWMWGPAGVGKSAVAQSCADLLDTKNKLGAALFFSRPNRRDDPNTLFTSLSYQVATRSRLYGDILDREIWNDPTLVKKSIVRQFQELLVKPLQELRVRGENMEERVIIIDGLDECADNKTQCDIIEIIATSVRSETTPFRWAFFSRAEPHIAASFGSHHVSPLSLRLELPVSREIDHEINCYLTYELTKIQEQHRLPQPWPPDREIGILVDLSAGLFIYAATIIRFISERNSSGPVDQLQVVLSLVAQRTETDSEHPLAELDLFYTLIMQRIPPKILPTVQKILLLQSIPGTSGDVTDARTLANVLGLSYAQFHNACDTLHSVLKLEYSYLQLQSCEVLNISFYHASFMDFIQAPQRSKEFSVYSCLETVRQELAEYLDNVHSRSTGMRLIGTGVVYSRFYSSFLKLSY